jgi:hypothetical protein
VTIIDEEAIICEPEGPAGGGEDDDDDPTGECVFARGVYSETPPRNGGPWCREGGLWCPCDSEADPPLWSVLQEENGGTSKGFGLLKNFNIFAPLDGFGTINSQDDGGGSPEAIPSPEAMFIVDLARVYVQVEESGGIGTQARVFWVENIMQFNTVVLKTYELLLRNYGFLPLLTEDVMGVQTEYNYFPETHYFYKECINNGEFLINRSTVFSSHPGLPESITKGLLKNKLSICSIG